MTTSTTTRPRPAPPDAASSRPATASPTARARLYAQRIDGRVALVDVPIDHAGRVLLIERHVESLAELEGIVGRLRRALHPGRHARPAGQPPSARRRSPTSSTPTTDPRPRRRCRGHDDPRPQPRGGGPALRRARVAACYRCTRPTTAGAAAVGAPTAPKPGKHPRSRHGVRDASADAAEIRAWWSTWPHANVGVATGRLVILDVDGAAGRATLAATPARPRAAAAHARRRPPAADAHLYFRADAHRVGNSAGRLGAGLDVRGRGGYVVAPPSLHADGHRYRWTRPATPRAAALLARRAADRRHGATAPRPAAQPPADRRSPAALPCRRLRGELADVAAARPGTRNDTLNRAAFRLAPARRTPATAASTSSRPAAGRRADRRPHRTRGAEHHHQRTHSGPAPPPPYTPLVPVRGRR